MKADAGLNIYFQKLLQMFTNAFEDCKDKKIVLYGIGAFSATVIERLTDFNIVGLMDRDPDNIGKILYGVPVLSKEQAEKEADLIVINTEASYWQTIYKRIQDIKIDVYYRNGQKAYLDDTPKCDVDLEYWRSGKEELLQKIDAHSTISFDIFDTLITRMIYLPADVFLLVELRLRSEMEGTDLPFSELRTKALHTTGIEEPNYDEIYEQFKRLSNLDSEMVEKIKQLEFEIEKQLLIPRDEMLDVFHYAREKNKKIILISDMYYQTERLKEILAACGIAGYEEIFVSCEYRKTKQNGQLYEEVFKKYDKNTLLHIGDNQYSDHDCVIKQGSNAYFVMSGRELLAHSSLSEIIPHICTVMDSMIIGTVVAKIFNDPFALCRTKGILYYEDAETMGYSVFGPLIFGFMHWLLRSAASDQIEKLLFFARDGYFLQDYFDQIQDFCEAKKIETEYFLISRRLAAVASICDEETFIEVAKLPYEGTFAEYMEKRWNVSIDREDPLFNTIINTSVHFDELLQNMMRYQNEIGESVRRDKKNYRKYCEKEIADKKIAIVDTWYYGNCQWYLSQILSRPVKGYYFAANLSKDNRNFSYNDLSACYNTDKDLKRGNVGCLKNSLHFESIFTAPQGMIRSCTESGFLYEKKGKNQQEFWLREIMAAGVKKFISDLISIVGKSVLSQETFDYGFCDLLYGLYWDDSIAVSKEISARMYNENYFQSSKEFLIIED